jgi:hypothetical protein
MADGTFLRFPRDIRGPGTRNSDLGSSDPQGRDPQGYAPQGHDPHGYDPDGYDAHRYDSHHHSDPHHSDPHGYDSDGSDSRDSDVQADRRGPASDPLVELARLIGRTDPFASLPPRGSAPPRVRDDAAQYGSVDSDQNAYHRRDFDHDHGGADEHLELSTRDRGYEDRFLSSQSPAPRGASSHDGEWDARSGDAARAHETADFSASRYRDHLPALEARAPLASDAFLASEEELAHQSPQQDHLGGAADYADAAADAPRHGEYGYEADSADEYQADEYGYEGSSAKRRYPVKVAVAVLGLAVFGTAGAFGYRTVLKGGHQGPPPVIHADNTPTKIVPSNASGDSGSKPINERLGDASQERIVKREETPVQLPGPATMPLSGVTNSVPPPSALAAAAAPTGPAVAPPATSLPAGAGGTTEPKRVRTVSIRADQALSGGAPATRSLTRTAALAPAGSPPSSGSAPLALTPQAVNAAAGVVGSTDPAPARPRAGSFVVQVSAQKSESEAEAAFHAMQARYAVLGGRQPLIRRKDQGDRGVFYVAQVGPFGTKDEASQMCESLKSAGGTCFVQKN